MQSPHNTSLTVVIPGRYTKYDMWKHLCGFTAVQYIPAGTDDVFLSIDRYALPERHFMSKGPIRWDVIIAYKGPKRLSGVQLTGIGAIDFENLQVVYPSYYDLEAE